jgi:hypothetical protein
MRAKEVSFWAPATDGGPGSRAHQAKREKIRNLDYTKDSLNRNMRNKARRDGCAYLSNGEKCTCIEGKSKVNGLYWCCGTHAKWFKNWAESKKNEYN